MKEPWATFACVGGSIVLVAVVVGVLILAVIGALYVLGVAA